MGLILLVAVPAHIVPLSGLRDLRHGGDWLWRPQLCTPPCCPPTPVHLGLGRKLAGKPQLAHAVLGLRTSAAAHLPDHTPLWGQDLTHSLASHRLPYVEPKVLPGLPGAAEPSKGLVCLQAPPNRAGHPHPRPLPRFPPSQHSAKALHPCSVGQVC